MGKMLCSEPVTGIINGNITDIFTTYSITSEIFVETMVQSESLAEALVISVQVSSITAFMKIETFAYCVFLTADHFSSLYQIINLINSPSRSHCYKIVNIQMQVFHHMQRPETSLCTKQIMQQSVYYRFVLSSGIDVKCS